MKYFQRKPDKRPEPRTFAAAQYTPGGDLAELSLVAPNIAECDLPTGRVLVCRFVMVHDDHPDQNGYEVVEPGDWLCASTDPHDSTGPWSDSTAGLSHWYDEVDQPEIPSGVGYVWAPGMPMPGHRPIEASDIMLTQHQPQVGWSETPEEMWRRVKGLPRVGDQVPATGPDGEPAGTATVDRVDDKGVHVTIEPQPTFREWRKVNSGTLADYEAAYGIRAPEVDQPDDGGFL